MNDFCGTLRLLVAFVATTQLLSPHAEAAERKLALFIAGPKSHGFGAHEHEGGCEMLARHLNASVGNLRAEVSKGWPEDSGKVAAADTLVVFSDGAKAHAAAGRVEALRKRYAAGKGLVVLHWALDPADEEMSGFFLDAIGGRFKQGHSANPIWLLKSPIIAEHPVTRGVKPFEVRDEFYYRLVLREGIVPLLQALPPATGSPEPDLASERDGTPETLAWAVEAPHGARGFGFSGGHFHRTWSEPSVRTLVLNAVLWTAGLEVPAEGTKGIAEPTTTKTIEDAIAKGDPAEVKRHLAFDPWRARIGGKSEARTPLDLALLRNQGEIVAILLDAGADPNPRPSAKRSPLHLAVERGSLASVNALLSAGANPDFADQHGWTPLHHAAARNKVEIASALLTNGAKASLLSKAGGTALHEAAAGAGDGMIRLLLDHQVDPDIRSKDGSTALDVAVRNKNSAAISLLSAR